MKKINFESKKTALIIFIILSLIFTSPLLFNVKKIANNTNIDWDREFVINHINRLTMIEYKQVPIWNPFLCGGNILFNHPYSELLSINTLFVLFFKEVIGLKTVVFVQAVICMFGMFLLSQKFGFKKYASYLPAIVYGLTNMFSMRVGVGHIMWMSASLIPYVFLFYLESFENTKKLFLSALFLAMIILSGGIYPFFFTILFLFLHTFLTAIFKNKKKSIKLFALIIIFTFLISSIKFLPVLEVLNQNPRTIYSKQYSDYKTLLKSLIGPKQYMTDSPNRGEEKSLMPLWWVEYAGYIGIIPFILFIVGIFINFKEQKELIIISFIFILIYLGHKSPIKIWELIRQFPIFSSLQVQTRSNMILIFCISIIAGQTLSKLENYLLKKKKQIIIIIILIISTIALLKTSMSSFNELLINNNYNNLNKSDIFYQTINTNVPGGIGYSFLLRNLGTTNCYENIVIRKTNEVTSYATEFYYHQGAAIPIESSEYQGEVYLLNSTEVLSNYSNCSNSNNTNTSRYTNCNRNISNTANYTFWSPNKLIVEINTQQADTLIINQNYHEPWKSYSNKQKIPVKNTNDLISVEIKPENKKITLYYLPTSFIIGSIITITTITGIIIWTRKKKKFI